MMNTTLLFHVYIVYHCKLHETEAYCVHKNTTINCETCNEANDKNAMIESVIRLIGVRGSFCKEENILPSVKSDYVN